MKFIKKKKELSLLVKYGNNPEFPDRGIQIISYD